MRHREHEQLLLGGEVPVDQRLVDADGARDVLHRRILHAALVEEGAGRLDDLAFALTPSGRPRASSRGRGRSHSTAVRHVAIIAVHTSDWPAVLKEKFHQWVDKRLHLWIQLRPRNGAKPT